MAFPGESVPAEEIVRAAWSAAVGERIARHARAGKLVRGKLIVGCDDEMWRRNLFTMSRMILSGVERLIGRGIVTDLDFRVVPERRGPQRAERSTSRPADEEAGGIEDPGLRRLYIASRKRELA